VSNILLPVFIVKGITFPILIKNIKPIIIDKYKLLLVSLCSSDTLTSINIRINKNKIDTAPIYTKRYDNPKKFNPINIKYIDIFKNKPIKYNTETIGFLLIITNIPDNIASKVKISIALKRKPLV
jgi:hypothetical protein